MSQDRRLAAFEGAYRSFTACIRGLPPERFSGVMENGSPRDLVARLVGWNQLTVLGCQAILDGKPAPYHADFANGYAHINAELVGREPQADPETLLRKLDETKNGLVAYLQAVPPEKWNSDQGVRHPDGGPATVRRCLEELTRSYLDGTDEITVWLETATRA
jgi:hypothetical protein